MTMSSNKIFQQTGGLRPGRSMFDLSYEKKFDCDMGQLIPIMCDEAIPGDKWIIKNQSVIRFQPLVAPILHEINQYVHYFFVPYRILWNNAAPDNWETFITGGVTGDLTPTIPRWDPPSGSASAKGTLWDYMGFPTGLYNLDSYAPLDFPRRAYNMIWNEYYRDQNLMEPVSLANGGIKYRCWEKDYFTSALPFQQRGTAPALPLSGVANAEFNTASWNTGAGTQALQIKAYPDNTIYTNGAYGSAIEALNNNEIDLTNIATFDVSDLRLAFQIQKWMERNARSGARYTEFLSAHYGVSPRDDRLQRPEYIGGSKAPVIISEVLQTSQTTTGSGASPQGNLAGHGICLSNAFAGKYDVKEFGLIIGIMSVMPRTAYQDGIDRQFLRETKFDFPFPEFCNLSEQAITYGEICLNPDEEINQTLFGYQGRYDELRFKRSQVCGNMRDTFNYWHLGRKFDFASFEGLNQTFLECRPRKDIFAAQDEPGLIVSFANIIKAFRPIPYMAAPGLIDHS